MIPFAHRIIRFVMVILILSTTRCVWISTLEVAATYLWMASILVFIDRIAWSCFPERRYLWYNND